MISKPWLANRGGSKVVLRGVRRWRNHERLLTICGEARSKGREIVEITSQIGGEDIAYFSCIFSCQFVSARRSGGTSGNHGILLLFQGWAVRAWGICPKGWTARPKHAVDPKQPQKLTRKFTMGWTRAPFPASDPVSTVQSAKSKLDAKANDFRSRHRTPIIFLYLPRLLHVRCGQ